ncbi:hypothetical protein DFS34DRAFT_222386 [Phlyctochytrium arcticum]|nr:hypothetical protein DFS34DRAFT_222386 [Phlyctochytrium arcticum]
MQANSETPILAGRRRSSFLRGILQNLAFRSKTNKSGVVEKTRRASKVHAEEQRSSHAPRQKSPATTLADGISTNNSSLDECHQDHHHSSPPPYGPYGRRGSVPETLRSNPSRRGSVSPSWSPTEGNTLKRDVTKSEGNGTGRGDNGSYMTLRGEVGQSTEGLGTKPSQTGVELASSRPEKVIHPDATSTPPSTDARAVEKDLTTTSEPVDPAQEVHEYMIGGERRTATIDELTTLVAFGVVLPTMTDYRRILEAQPKSSSSSIAATVSSSPRLSYPFHSNANNNASHNNQMRRRAESVEVESTRARSEHKMECFGPPPAVSVTTPSSPYLAPPEFQRGRRRSLPTTPSELHDTRSGIRGGGGNPVHRGILKSQSPLSSRQVVSSDDQLESTRQNSLAALASVGRSRSGSGSSNTVCWGRVTVQEYTVDSPTLPPIAFTPLSKQPDPLSTLPPSIPADIALELPSFERLLKQRMTPAVFMKGEYIIRKREIGREMYFLSNGKVEVVSGDGKRIYSVIGQGSFFGELGVYFNLPRTASVRAAEMCYCMMLTRSHLEQVLQNFPCISVRFHVAIAQRMEEVRGHRENASSSSSASANMNLNMGPSLNAVNKGFSTIQEELVDEMDS